jgi:hypothetical protein
MLRSDCLVERNGLALTDHHRNKRMMTPLRHYMHLELLMFLLRTNRSLWNAAAEAVVEAAIVLMSNA